MIIHHPYFTAASIPFENRRHDREDTGGHVPGNDKQAGQHPGGHTVQAVALRRGFIDRLAPQFRGE